MISNRFYYSFTLLAIAVILSSCLGSSVENMDNTISRDAQITSVQMSSYEDTLKVLPKVYFSIDQVSSVPLIFNKDSLPYLFDVSNVSLKLQTKGASGIKLHLINPDSSYIWNQTDSVEINKLKHIEVFAQDGITTKRYTIQLNTHQQDPDIIFWQNIINGYMPQPNKQVTVSDNSHFFTYYKLNNNILLTTSSIDDGTQWSSQQLSGLPQDIVLKTIQNIVFDENRKWYALDIENKIYTSINGKEWNTLNTSHTVKSIFGKFPSFTKDSILTVIEDEGEYKFAKTKDFSSFHILNNVPTGFPVSEYTFTTVKDSLNYTAKYLIVTGGKTIDQVSNQRVWLLQESETEIRSTSIPQVFNVQGSSLFNYDKKIYLMTSSNNKNVFYTSSNYGAFWKQVSDKQLFPTEFTLRKDQSVIVDEKNNVWIFGGHNNFNSQIVEVWKGRINKLFIQ